MPQANAYRSPVFGSAPALYQSVKVGRHPAAIKIARLGDNFFISDETGFHHPCIEGDMPGKRLKAITWLIVCPCRTFCSVPLTNYVEIPRFAFPLAKALSCHRLQDWLDVRQWQVIGRRMMRFENPQRPVRVCDDLPAKPDDDTLRHRLERRRPRIRLDILSTHQWHA